LELIHDLIHFIRFMMVLNNFQMEWLEH